ncbi:DUF4249 domain-containing protein [Sphingobacterium griseoflavum]|uniref:DUF4249 domain-containing protein n=1 Tax=Sphingobacterium griseoflavum TaxID=1474952 RepID=A0ABQ3HS26_9SPHI|nr:DUF4249 domain-containing protein [Sphingobacterium griseoflavum]GHE23138.1 hypothetical protein GCM10017764_01060 [Sphingobacterium griseoflavum]
MMKARFYLYILFFFAFWTSCEEVIDINLNDADPRVVIEAQLSDLSTEQRIRVSQTVAFTESISASPISDAQVSVTDSRGRVYTFNHTEDGYYIHSAFRPVADRRYDLLVEVAGERFESSCTMPPFVEVDSVGILQETLFGDPYYFATFKFQDPAGTPNYYKYDVSINSARFRFASALSDKFNDGLYVTHQISDRDTELVVGDSIVVRRYCVDRRVFDYWNEYQSTNPGTAAPGNPTSNISNNALGYFSVASVKEFGMRIPEEMPTEGETN